MSEEIEMQDKQTKKTVNRKKLYYSIAALVVVAVLLVGFSFAWFFNKTDMATLMPIKEPSNITILGPNGSELTSLDLNYTAADKNGNTVTVRRVICVQSAADKFKLEIAHTTNLKGLTFKLYPVSSNGTDSVTDSGYTYSYNAANPIEGTYINLDHEKDYKYANTSKHNNNYGDYQSVQTHAEPLYWLTSQPLNADKSTVENQVTIDGVQNHRTYYVCEVTWTETTKETDIFYILAQTA